MEDFLASENENDIGHHRTDKSQIKSASSVVTDYVDGALIIISKTPSIVSMWTLSDLKVRWGRLENKSESDFRPIIRLASAIL